MEESKILSALFKYGWPIVMGILAWLGKSKIDGIESRAKDALPRAEFNNYAQSASKDRDERRQSEILLFARVDSLRDHVDESMGDLRTHIDNKVDNLITSILRDKR